MRRLIFAFLFLFALIPIPIHAQNIDDVIEQYHIHVSLTPEGSATIEERILYSFDRNNAHGIFRKIPTYYTNGIGSAELPVSLIDVTDELGNELTVLPDYGSAALNLRIGDPDIELTGSHWYYITYRIEDIVSRFETWDELHLDAIGTEWDARILAATITVSLPEPGFQRGACYTGGFGSQDSNCTVATSPSQITYTLDQPLNKSEGMTVVAGFDQGIVAPVSTLSVNGTPGAYVDIGDGQAHFMNQTIRVAPGDYVIKAEKTWHHTKIVHLSIEPGESAAVDMYLRMTILGQLLVYVLPILVFILLQYALYMHYQKRGKHEPGRGVVIAQYAPERGMYPALAGHLHNQIVDRRDLSASILSIASKGYLDIEIGGKEKKPTYTLHKKTPAKAQSLPKAEQEIFEAFFPKNSSKKSVKLTEVRTQLSKAYRDAGQLVNKEVIERGYYPEDPIRAKVRTGLIGVAIIVSAFFLVIPLVFIGLGIPAALFIFGGECILIAPFMGKRTEKGSLAREHILGLREFIRIAEIDRIKFFHSPSSPDYRNALEALLPYAIIFGLEEEWAKIFHVVAPDQAPDWLQTKQRMNAVALASAMNRFNTAVITTSVPARSSSSSSFRSGSGFGGGSVGGGFGGGGGGSW